MEVVFMRLKLFGDTQKIDWQALNVKMPFAPMHELAEKYELSRLVPRLSTLDGNPPQFALTTADIMRTFELIRVPRWETKVNLFYRILIRTDNTITALDQCTPDTICINLGGGMHHAGKYPASGYAYSLINDIIWAVDYQLEQDKTVGIIDLDFHFGGGTYEYYLNNFLVQNYDSYHPRGVLRNHADLLEPDHHSTIMNTFDLTVQAPPMSLPVFKCDKIILNIGTDWYKNDTLFGQYGQMEGEDLLTVWKRTIRQITNQGIPLAITCGGGYGSEGLKLYAELIEWIRALLSSVIQD